jgi:hypothetical protein
MTFLLDEDETITPMCDEHLSEEARRMCRRLREVAADNSQ